MNVFADPELKPALKLVISKTLEEKQVRALELDANKKNPKEVRVKQTYVKSSITVNADSRQNNVKKSRELFQQLARSKANTEIHADIIGNQFREAEMR